MHIESTKTFSISSHVWINLIDSKEKKDQKKFNEFMVGALSELTDYVNFNLRSSEKKVDIANSKYEANDIIDQLYIEAYNNILTFKDEVTFNRFLYQKSDELIDDLVTEEEFDHLFFENIDNLTKGEWKSLKEDYWLDADGDSTMNEELDQRRVSPDMLTLIDGLTSGDEDSLLNELSDKVDKEELGEHLELILRRVPKLDGSIYYLRTAKKMLLEQIAKLKSMDEKEVVKLFESVQLKLGNSLISRYK